MTGPDLLALAAVLPHLVLGEGGAGQQLGPPLAGGHDVGDQDERAGAGPGHGPQADQGLARPARQHDHAAAGGDEGVDRLLLVGPQVEAGARPAGSIGWAVPST